MGKFFEYIKMAIKNILSNKGRSFLTMLGIIIGISSVIAIMGVGDGISMAMNSEADAVGGGQLYIYCSQDAITNKELISEEDMQAIKERVDGVNGVTPSMGASGITATGKGEFSISMSGGSADYVQALNYNIKRGRYFNESDVEESRAVCAITDADAKRLYGSDDVVGMSMDITVGEIVQTYQIIGVMEQKENTAFVSYSYEGMPVTLDVPYTSLEAYQGEFEGTQGVYVFADKTMDQKKISESVIRLLENRHPQAEEGYYQIQSFQDMLESLNTMLSMVTVFISFVAAISLLVGGIGVMNIMLVSVTERTREIGIRKSLGARTSSITLQFLAESAIISVLGGIIGIVLGYLGSLGICSLMSGSMGSEIAPGLTFGTIVTAAGFSCAVGIFFGIYPARKAAKLSPIEALRRN